ncbi:phosphoadenosine phosphosulfate reductase family protein [Brevibacillus sp. MS2.2]|nr:phosphoadenosine phosphosulfate reductase family protein [Brevibacillus sp. MS2.2]
MHRWREKDIWVYVEQEEIPYNDLYKMNIIQTYRKKLDILTKNNE